MEEKKGIKINLVTTICIFIIVCLIIILGFYIHQNKLLTSEKQQNVENINNFDNLQTTVSDTKQTIDNNLSTNNTISSTDTHNSLNSLDTAKIENVIKNKIIEIAKTDQDLSLEHNVKYAEAHTIFGRDIKNNIAYYTVLADYGAYQKNNNGEYSIISGSSGIPMLIGINSNYEIVSCKMPMDGHDYNKSVKEIFPNDLADMIINEELEIENSQKQINGYLN